MRPISTCRALQALHGAPPAISLMKTPESGLKGRAWAHEFRHRPRQQQVPRQDGLGGGQAARLLRHSVHRRGAGLPRRQVCTGHRRRRRTVREEAERRCIRTVADIQRIDAKSLVRRYGETGLWLPQLRLRPARKEGRPGRRAQERIVGNHLNDDISAPQILEDILWRQSERTAARAKHSGVEGRVVTLKLKTHDFRTFTAASPSANRPSWRK